MVCGDRFPGFSVVYPILFVTDPVDKERALGSHDVALEENIVAKTAKVRSKGRKFCGYLDALFRRFHDRRANTLLGMLHQSPIRAPCCWYCAYL